MAAYNKLCPQCKTETTLQAAWCHRCGHTFRTQFDPATGLAQTRLSQALPPQSAPQLTEEQATMKDAAIVGGGLTALLGLHAVQGVLTWATAMGLVWFSHWARVNDHALTGTLFQWASVIVALYALWVTWQFIHNIYFFGMLFLRMLANAFWNGLCRLLGVTP